jgi:(S)-mandelate dehydrogenase
LPRFAFDYLDGGAGNERCLDRNRHALDSLALVPDALCDVTDCSTKTLLLGHEHAYPIILAPTGLNGLLWHDGDVALAHAARSVGIPSVISTASTSPINEVVAANPGCVWFQLYAFGDRRITESLMRTASSAGCTVLMLTVDTAVSGNRTRDLRNGFTIPFRPTPRMILDLLARPRWLLDFMRFGMPDLVNIAAPTETAGVADARAMLLRRNLDRSLTWKSIDWLRERWPGQFVLKGILRPSDSKRAIECGVDAIVVSNHGGRQLDSAPATIEVLSAVLDAAGQAVPVLIDSGFRTADDIVKALALGASAVLLGRFPLYALAAGGEKGVTLALGALVEDLIRTLRLLGVSDIRKLRPDHVHAHSDQRFASWDRSDPIGRRYPSGRRSSVL